MNQTQNFIQWKNLTPEVQAEHDFENYKYEEQSYNLNAWADYVSHHGRDTTSVYRLVIEPDKYYYLKLSSGMTEVIIGANLLKDDYRNIHLTLRPAKPSEVPQPETLEDRIKAKYSGYEVVMLGPIGFAGSLGIAFPESANTGTYKPHIYAQSMKFFQGYVYEWEDGLKENVLPVICNGNKYMQPVAVLFEVEG